jgi:hypothetical protein
VYFYLHPYQTTMLGYGCIAKWSACGNGKFQSPQNEMSSSVRLLRHREKPPFRGKGGSVRSIQGFQACGEGHYRRKPGSTFLVMLIKFGSRISRSCEVLREGIDQLLLPVALELCHPE